VIAALSSILVARLLGSTAYGAMGIALVPASIIGLFGDLGITQAMIRFSAQCNSQGRSEESKAFIRAGMFLQFLLGLLLSLGAFFLSSFMADKVFQKPDLAPLIGVASFMILFNSVVMACQASFTGNDRMGYYSLTMLLQSMMKITIAPVLVLLGYGALGAIAGNAASLLITATCAVIIVYLFLIRPLNHEEKTTGLLDHLRIMLSYGYPLFVSILLSGSLSQIYNFLMALYCSEYLVGNYLVTTKFAVLIGFFTMPISTVLFPAFSQLDRNKDKERLKFVFQSSVKYTGLVTLPVVSALIVLSQPIISFLFGIGYEPASSFLVLYSFSNVLIGLGGLSVLSLLNGQGLTRATMVVNVVTLLSGVPLSLYLIPRYEIVGLLSCMIISAVPGLAVGVWWVRQAFGFSIDFKSCAKTYVTAFASALGTYLLVPMLGPGDLKAIVIGGLVYLVLYAVLLPLTKAVERADIANLKELLGGLGPLSRIFDSLLSIADRILSSR